MDPRAVPEADVKEKVRNPCLKSNGRSLVFSRSLYRLNSLSSEINYENRRKPQPRQLAYIMERRIFKTSCGVGNNYII